MSDSQVRNAGRDGGEVLLGRNRTIEMRGEDCGIGFEDIAVQLSSGWNRCIGDTDDSATNFAIGLEERRASLAGQNGKFTAPCNELAAFAIAADPFELATVSPVLRHFGGGGEFDRSMRSRLKQFVHR